MIHLSGTTEGGLKSSKQEDVLNTEESAYLSVYHKYSISIFCLFFPPVTVHRQIYGLFRSKADMLLFS